ncbi:MAG: DUF2301 domain-containing membrane protein [Cyanobacteria bacterium J06639_14]
MTVSTQAEQESVIYQGQFGPFTIEEPDRREVILYRAGLFVAALCFALGTSSVFWQGDKLWVLQSLSGLYTVFWLALGLSLLKIHIYLKPLHRLLQGFWLVGGVASLAIAHFSPEPFVLTVYQQPVSLWGVGFTFAALTGIFFKEAFCFNRFETKLLTPIVPLLLLGHLFQFLPASWESILLALWAINFLIFALRKVIQPIPPDIGDKSVFEYLARQEQQASTAA